MDSSITIKNYKQMETIKKILPYDKCLHIILGIVIYLISYIFFKYILNIDWAEFLALGIVVLAAFIREYKAIKPNEKFKNKWDWLDIVYTICIPLLISLIH